PSMLRRWRNGDADGHAPDGILRHPDLLTVVQHAVDRVNARLSRTEQIRRFVVLGRELTAEDGDLTPTLKLRRGVVAALYQTVEWPDAPPSPGSCSAPWPSAQATAAPSFPVRRPPGPRGR